MPAPSPECPACGGAVFGPPKGGIVFEHAPGPGTRVRCDACGLLVTLGGATPRAARR